MGKRQDSSSQSTLSEANAQSFVVRIPDAQLYWSVLDLSPLGLRGWQTPQEQQVLNLFDAALPLAVEQVQVAALRLDRNTIVVCGIERGMLDVLIQKSPNARVAVPASVPIWLRQEVGESWIDPNSLNLLRGVCEPRAVRRSRRAMHLHAVAALLLIAFVVVFGAERRRTASFDALSAVSQARQVMYERTLETSTAETKRGQPLAARFTSELRRLQQTRGSVARTRTFNESNSEQLYVTLHSLFAMWPMEQHMQTETITMSNQAVTIIGTLPSASHAEQSARTIGSFAPDQWVGRQPAMQSASREGSVRLTLRLERTSKTAGDSGS